jgi:hypothetical protein
VPKSTTFANSLLELVLKATTFADFAENDSTSPATNLYLSLHTADPGVGGSQTTNEAAYTNYTRVAVARSGSGWTVTGAAAENAALVQFPQCGASGATVTHVAIGKASSGTGLVLWAGALNASLAVANLIQPQFAAGALDLAES